MHRLASRGPCDPVAWTLSDSRTTRLRAAGRVSRLSSPCGKVHRAGLTRRRTSGTCPVLRCSRLGFVLRDGSTGAPRARRATVSGVRRARSCVPWHEVDAEVRRGRPAPGRPAPWATSNEPGYDDPDGASIIDPDGRGPAIGFMRVPEGKTAKNRMHIDIRVAGEPPWNLADRARLIRAKVQDLTPAGAVVVREKILRPVGRPCGHGRPGRQRVLRRVIGAPIRRAGCDLPPAAQTSIRMTTRRVVGALTPSNPAAANMLRLPTCNLAPSDLCPAGSPWGIPRVRERRAAAGNPRPRERAPR